MSLPPDTAVALLRDVSVALAKKFRAVALVNVNQEAANLEALKRATEEAKKAGASVCLTEFAKKRWVDRLGAAFNAGDHAGSFETSLMMACARAQVREKERISLPPMDPLGPAPQEGRQDLRRGGRRGRLLRRPHRRERRGGRGPLRDPRRHPHPVDHGAPGPRRRPEPGRVRGSRISEADRSGYGERSSSRDWQSPTACLALRGASPPNPRGPLAPTSSRAPGRGAGSCCRRRCR